MYMNFVQNQIYMKIMTFLTNKGKILSLNGKLLNNIPPIFVDDGNYIAAWHTRYGVTNDGSDNLKSWLDQTNSWTLSDISSYLPSIENDGIYFDGTERIKTPSTFQQNLNDYTIEVYVKSDTVDSVMFFLSSEYYNSNYIGSPQLRISKSSNSGAYYTVTNGTNFVSTINSLFYFPYEIWTHFCISRCGSNVYLFLNGVLKGVAISSDALWQTQNHTLVLGNQYYGAGQNWYKGKLDRVYISNICRYNGSGYSLEDIVFTPPGKDES